MSFDSFGLLDQLVRAVADQGYSEPTPIQLQAIPIILEGRDLMGGAQTGTGKTAGFTLPLLHRLSKGERGKGRRPVRALILTPTRELAAQVGESIKTYGQHLPLKSTVLFGGVKIGPQIAKLRRGVDTLVSTPGRLLDHVNQGTVDLSGVEILVLDEADRMLDMGFIPDVRKIIALLPKERQSLLFSVSFSAEIKKLADSLLNSPVLIEIARDNTVSECVEQVIHPVDRERKRELLSYLIGSEKWRQVLVFTRTKYGADRLAQQLEKDGISAIAIHGNKSQGARTRALAIFKKGSVRVLVATDVAARGLDIDQLPCVVNFELPDMSEDYVHRIGRTGRAGNKGKAVSLVCVDELKLLREIQRLIKLDLPKVVIPGYKPDPSIKPKPIRGGRNARSFGSGGNRRSSDRSRGKSNSFGKRRDSEGRSSGGNRRSSDRPRGQSFGNRRDDEGRSSGGNRRSSDRSRGKSFGNRRDDEGRSSGGNRRSSDRSRGQSFGNSRDDEGRSSGGNRRASDRPRGQSFGNRRDDEGRSSGGNRRASDRPRGKSFGNRRDDEGRSSGGNRRSSDRSRGQSFGNRRDDEGRSSGGNRRASDRPRGQSFGNRSDDEGRSSGGNRRASDRPRGQSFGNRSDDEGRSSGGNRRASDRPRGKSFGNRRDDEGRSSGGNRRSSDRPRSSARRGKSPSFGKPRGRPANQRGMAQSRRRG